MPFFSVIVPIYSVEAYLPKCIDSVIEQTYTDFELILVDDGSPDGCGRICDEYAEKDSRIRVIHKENGGLISARKAGAQAAKGDYVCCLDGDDWIAPNYLELIANEISSTDSEIVCVGMVLSYSDRETEHPIRFEPGAYDRVDIEEKIFPQLIQNSQAGYFAPSLAAKAIKRELYLPMQLAVDPRIKIGEDGACTIPCVYRAQSISVLPECLYYYRQNEVSMTKDSKAFPWNGPELITEHLKAQLDISLFDFEQQLYRKTVHELFSVVVSQFNRNEPYRVIKQDILQKLQIPIYSDSVDKAVFSSLRGKLAAFALKHRATILMRLWNYIKK